MAVGEKKGKGRQYHLLYNIYLDCLNVYQVEKGTKILGKKSRLKKKGWGRISSCVILYNIHPRDKISKKISKENRKEPKGEIF